MEIPRETRKSYQIRALFRKAAVLQLRQKGTNFCQIITPIFCLLLVYLMKEIAQSQIKDENDAVILETIPRILNPPLVPNYVLYNLVGLSINDCEQWYYYDFATNNPETYEFIGTLSGEYFAPDNNTSTGLLGNIPNYFCRSNVKNNPYFARPESTINQDIFDTIKVMNENPIYNKQSIYGSFLPDGAVTFYNANKTNLKYKAQINDHRFMSYHRNNGITKLSYPTGALNNSTGNANILTITDGMLTMIDMIHQALFRTLFNDTEIMTLIQYMPIKFHEQAELNRLLNILGASLYPIALSLLLPVFMYSVVLEKEEKLQDFMKMNGMRIMNYWVVNFIFDFIVYGLTVFTFMAFGIFVVQLQYFTQTNALLVFILLFGWGISQIALAFFIQVFINKARTATIWGYLLSIWTVLWGITLNLAVYPIPQELPWYLFLYPHFSMTRAIYILSYNCGYYKCVEEFSEVSDELKYCITSLYACGSIILVISIYLNEIVPREFGVAKHPLFFLRKKKQIRSENLLDSLESINESYTTELIEEDQQVKEERQGVYNIEPPYFSFPLLVKDLRKIYKGKGGRPDKIAVKRMCLRVNEGELFGLLGPNGAGKTTLISMLTGLYKPDSGNAWIAGFDITNELDQVQLIMGVCPQFDILWPDLTVYEHLLFYARLKGIAPYDEHNRVQLAMKDVYLTQFKNLKTNELSGGMRRRLSVAIALVGNPKIVFLDEPTTGLDPENRRQLWDILANCKEGKAMVLTTHSMEEADVLCSRIAIVNDGVLRCLGPQVVLKSLYGGGYHLFINCQKPNYHSNEDQAEIIESVKSFVSNVLPAAVILSEFNGNLIYQIPLGCCKVSNIFSEFEQNKVRIGIADWGISQSSLEDVFMKVIGAD